jgi:hypothetical protein
MSEAKEHGQVQDFRAILDLTFTPATRGEIAASAPIHRTIAAETT